MSFALLIIGITLIVAAVRNTHMQLIGLISGDFSGPGNFIFWVIALLVIGSIGYIKPFRPVSVAMLVLILLVLFLTKGDPGSPTGGFFQKFMQAIGTTTRTQSASVPASPAGSAVILEFPGTQSF